MKATLPTRTEELPPIAGDFRNFHLGSANRLGLAAADIVADRSYYSQCYMHQGFHPPKIPPTATSLKPSRQRVPRRGFRISFFKQTVSAFNQNKASRLSFHFFPNSLQNLAKRALGYDHFSIVYNTRVDEICVDV